MLRICYALIYLFCLSLISFPLSAKTYTSSDYQVNMLELYTSEGCSSCPPADKWLSKLKQDKRLWTELIPIAFHVDYWDYIGWKDRFADKAFSNRQRRYAQEKQVSTVYTPGMLLNGEEWRNWYRNKPMVLDNSRVSGKLSIKVNDKHVSAKYFSNIKTDKSLVFHVAILGFNLTSKIHSGENEGRTLRHDFVVLAYDSIKMSTSEQKYIVNKLRIPKTSIVSKQTAIASWISEEYNLTPIQATSGWLNQ